METFLIKALQLILALLILVVVHEFGHYIFSRMFGIKVEKFYLFFDPWFEIFKWKPKPAKNKKYNKDGSERASWRDTEYGIGWLPLGGYVKIAGMIDESMDTEQLSKDPQPWEFRTKPAWQRLLVMVAGVVFNFILAIIIYTGIAYCWGEKVISYDKVTEGMDYCEEFHNIGFKDGDVLLALNGKPIDVKDNTHRWNMIQDGAVVTVLRNHSESIDITIPKDFVNQLISNEDAFMNYRFPVVVSVVSKGEPADLAGLQEGDRIIKLGNDTTPSFSEFAKVIPSYGGKTIPILISRGDSIIESTVTPTENGKLGFIYHSIVDLYPTEEKDYTFFEAIPRGIKIGVDQLTMYVSSLKLLFSKEGAQNLGGFGAIGNMFPDAWNWYSFWQITAFLSIILAFMNIIPIPALDGGHVLFLIYEIVTRRKPSDKFMEYAQYTGMAILFLLLIYANGNDIYRLIFK
jgi:regulator of sigma E protease